MRRAILAFLLIFLATPVHAQVVKVLGRRAAAADTTAPDAIADLSTNTPTSSTCVLSWTAPGDDGATGTATTYECKQIAGQTTFTSGEYAGATATTGTLPTPSVAGTTNEHFTASGLSANTPYGFACKTADEVPNWSAISNAGTCTTASLGFCTAGSFGFCDEFTTDTSANYDQYGNSQTWAIASGKATGPTAGSVALSLIYKTATSSTNQYAIMKFDTVNDDQGLFLHAQAGTAPMDVVYITSGAHGCTGSGTPVSCCTGASAGATCKNIYWSEMTVLGAPTSTLGADIGSCVINAPSAGDYLMASVNGTDVSRDVSAWVTSTAPTAAPSGTPTCEWDNIPLSGCTGDNCCKKNGTPDVGCTCERVDCIASSEPANGTRVGLWQYGASPSRTYDNFAGGP